MPKIVSTDDFIGPDDASALLGVSRSFLYARSYKSSPLDGPPVYRIGGRLRYRKSELIAWATAHAVERNAPDPRHRLLAR